MQIRSKLRLTMFRYPSGMKSISRWLGIACCIVLISTFFFGSTLQADEIRIDESKKILEKYFECINQGNVESYIDLFTEDNRIAMDNFWKNNPEDTFFQEKNIVLEGIMELPNGVLEKCTLISKEELDEYDMYKAYYTEISGNFEYRNSETHVFKVFVIVWEEAEWKILKIVVPQIAQLLEEGISMFSESERIAMSRQVNLLADTKSESVQESSKETMATTLSYTCPQSIRVYFNKTENIQHFGSTAADIEFHDYVRDAVPGEWIVSYYGQYPTYLQAGVMASKMFGWYHTVYPVYQFAPYYADVMDDTNSQQYTYNCSKQMSSVHQGYLNNAMNYAYGLVMVTERTEELFLVQWRSDRGEIHSGILNQIAALELAKEGKSAVEILNTYLGSTPYTRGQMIKFMTCNEVR